MEENVVIGNKYQYWQNQRLVFGTIANIFQGQNLQTQEALAFKIYNNRMYGLIGGQVQIHNVIAEIVRKDICPFISKTYECLEIQDNICLVMELCDQGSLEQQMYRKKKIQENEALFILFQLLQALALLAKNNIAHRIIKPEHILIKDGVYKLGSFTFAKQKPTYKTKLGTLAYMAPEIFTNDEYDQKVDMWSLGLVIHQMLFGELYFIGNNHKVIEESIQTKQYDLDDQKYAISDEFKVLLKQMLQKDPKQRISAEDALQQFGIFNQFQNDPRYIKIMDDEKQLLKQFDKTKPQQPKQYIQIEEEESIKQQKQFQSK
ncbi:unnamed protein product (macronuclear) [Paramecium tetraurelia]|uniref:Protein kinase domain-containing protein n=1 Tax=Paramecium tetraurelia TaxID=5888 RepID=A0DVR7_PARTE|nr:uncharacterized protein GSPATT00020787001 [Paramecium tetraurelia]CAK87134.1 unnamed protein product [Paramecium tetraurelia]|eukprot:XP_001454531.1 hypothetical protein (macronuclear) [Paramecium tetraurelia strain d4-2]